jgi:hypothetical protein
MSKCFSTCWKTAAGHSCPLTLAPPDPALMAPFGHSSGTWKSSSRMALCLGHPGTASLGSLLCVKAQHPHLQRREDSRLRLPTGSVRRPGHPQPVRLMTSLPHYQVTCKPKFGIQMREFIFTFYSNSSSGLISSLMINLPD